jgi:hypothetical protein
MAGISQRGQQATSPETVGCSGAELSLRAEPMSLANSRGVEGVSRSKIKRRQGNPRRVDCRVGNKIATMRLLSPQYRKEERLWCKN